MNDQKFLIPTLWLTSSLVLLASLLVTPTRASGSVTGPSRPERLLLAPAPPPGPPTTYLGAATATDDVAQVNALPAENEEQDRVDALDEPRMIFSIPRSFRRAADRQVIVPRSILSRYPLRC